MFLQHTMSKGFFHTLFHSTLPSKNASNQPQALVFEAMKAVTVCTTYGCAVVNVTSGNALFSLGSQMALVPLTSAWVASPLWSVVCTWAHSRHTERPPFKEDTFYACGAYRTRAGRSAQDFAHESLWNLLWDACQNFSGGTRGVEGECTLSFRPAAHKASFRHQV